jgi:hypothetical protein
MDTTSCVTETATMKQFKSLVQKYPLVSLTLMDGALSALPEDRDRADQGFSESAD